jgi:hypothetical protein
MKTIYLLIDGEKLYLSKREKEIFLSLGKALLERRDKTSSITQLAKLTGHNPNSVSKMAWMLLYKKFVKLKVVHVKKENEWHQARCFKVSRKGEKFFTEEVFKKGKERKEEKTHAELDIQ